jgi:hypothetical protein
MSVLATGLDSFLVLGAASGFTPNKSKSLLVFIVVVPFAVGWFCLLTATKKRLLNVVHQVLGFLGGFARAGFRGGLEVVRPVFVGNYTKPAARGFLNRRRFHRRGSLFGWFFVAVEVRLSG